MLWLQPSFFSGSLSKKRLKPQQKLGLRVPENLDFCFCLHEVAECSLVASSPHDVVVNPVIISTARLAHEQPMVKKSVLIQPRLGHCAMLFCTRSEKCDDVPVCVPLIQCLQSIRKRHASGHALRLLIGYVVCDCSVNVNHIILHLRRELR